MRSFVRLAQSTILALVAAALTLDEVNAFVRRFYDPANFTMLTLRPE